MRWVAILGLACGCNQLFGIQQTDLVDAPPPIPDAPPPSCPALGVAPKFGSDLAQVAGRFCEAYSLDETQQWAAAMSYDYKPPNYAASIVSGPAGEQPLIQTMDPELLYPINARLAPEGNVLFVTSSTSDWDYKTFAYELVGDRWVVKSNFVPPGHTLGEYYLLSTPSRGPVRRMVMQQYDATLALNYLIELQYDGTQLTEVARTPLTALEVTEVVQPSLSADGLRLVFTTAKEISPTTGGDGPVDVGMMTDQPVLYVDRESVSKPFDTKAQILETVPSYVGWPYLTEDCGRVYFSALNTVWYLKYEPSL